MKEIIKKISTGREVINVDDIIKIVSLLVDWYDLDEFYSGIEFSSHSRYTAIYNLISEKFTFNDDRILKGAYNLYDLVNNVYHVNKKCFNYYLNAYYLYTICHEIDHANQKKRAVLTLDDDYHSFMYDISNLLRKGKKAYIEHHDIFPMERKSINSGGLMAYNLMRQTNMPERDLDVLYLIYLIRRSNDYHLEKDSQIISPAKQFFSLEIANEYLERMNELLNGTNLSLDERLDYGLDISYDEFMALKDEKHKLYEKIKSKNVK